MDGPPQEWPEPIVPVQSLSESGITTVPDQYVKPPSERPTDIDASGGIMSTTSIPVIDLSGLAAEGSAGDARAAMNAISDACRDWGFFQVVNHGVSPDLLSRIRRVWSDFFRLPTEAKQAYANSPATYEGYGSRLGVAKGAILDWGDYFYLHLLPLPLRKHDKWPAIPSASSRETIEEYGVEVTKLCELLMKVMSMSLGLEVGQLQEAFGGSGGIGACMRANYYPRCPQPELTLGLSPHSDPGGLTVLLADDGVRGLQVRKGAAWVDVRPAVGALIVNIGDQIQIVSNAEYRSVEHRVVANAAVERMSLAFFYNPRSDLPLGPAAEMLSAEQPPLYRPMTFNEYRVYIRTLGPRGKSQVDSLGLQIKASS